MDGKNCSNCKNCRSGGTFCGWESSYCTILKQDCDFKNLDLICNSWERKPPPTLEQIMEQEAKENLQETWEDMQDCIKDQLFAFCKGDEKELERCNSALNQATTAYQKASKNYEKYTR